MASLNYDILLDRSILQQYSSINYGLPATRIMGMETLSINPGSPELLKLHGSFGWHKPGLIGFPRPPNLEIEAYPRFTSQSEFSNAIVYPGTTKEQQVSQEPYKSIWDVFMNAVRSSDKIIIIGSSVMKKDSNDKYLKEKLLPYKEKIETIDSSAGWFERIRDPHDFIRGIDATKELSWMHQIAWYLSPVSVFLIISFFVCPTILSKILSLPFSPSASLLLFGLLIYPIHEATHYVMFCVFGGKPRFRLLKSFPPFGVEDTGIYPRNQSALITISPVILISILAILLATIMPSIDYLFVLALGVNFSDAGFDIWKFITLLKYPNTVVGHLGPKVGIFKKRPMRPLSP
ncbi:Putative zincin peptidase [Candidatus Anstonella stagnisolia]|nr:Putative zincin peptidase [Candidatus Anstonella stagnisolia]